MLTNLLVIFLFTRLPNIGSVRLIVGTSEPLQFLHRYYREIGNEDPPPKSDPTAKGATQRLRTCEKINNSGVFEMHKFLSTYRPVDVRQIYVDLKKPEYSDIYHLVYGGDQEELSDPNEYSNRYIQRTFRFDTFDVTEHVFSCFLIEVHSKLIVPYYVSKSYNLENDQRFVFVEPRPYQAQTFILLIEKSSEAYVKPDFNVELHYLELKKRHKKTVSSSERDPVCRLKSEILRLDQSFRLCTAVLSPLYKRREFRHLRSLFSSGAVSFKKRISFRTAEALHAVPRRWHEYKEWMLSCVAMGDEGIDWYYISRAYNPNEVFVYKREHFGLDIYLKALNTNVSIVNEPYNFGNVET